MFGINLGFGGGRPSEPSCHAVFGIIRVSGGEVAGVIFGVVGRTLRSPSGCGRLSKLEEASKWIETVT